jgi:phage gpG-like protein
MTTIQTKINDDDLQKLLSELVRRLGDMTPAMNAVGEDVVESVMTNFERGGRPQWPKLSEATIRQRSRLGKWPGMILVRSGAAGGLMGSIHHSPAPTRVIISANKKYAALHQFGAAKGEFGAKDVIVHGHTRRTKYGKVSVRQHSRRQLMPWGNIPARPFLMVQDEDWITIRNTLAGFLMRL